jgi:phasin family protein
MHGHPVPGRSRTGSVVERLRKGANGMTTTPQDFSATAKAQVEAITRIATIAAEGAERLADLHMKTARATFDESLKQAKALAALKDPSELPALAAKLMQPNVDKFTTYAREVYEALTTSQTELAKAMEEQFAELNKQAVVTLDGMMKNAPAGSEVAVAAVKQAMGAANQAYETMTKAARSVGSAVEANIAAVQPAAGSRKKAA